jgi:hypothetical protein
LVFIAIKLQLYLIADLQYSRATLPRKIPSLALYSFSFVLRLVEIFSNEIARTDTGRHYCRRFHAGSRPPEAAWGIPGAAEKAVPRRNYVDTGTAGAETGFDPTAFPRAAPRHRRWTIRSRIICSLSGAVF